MEKKIIHTLPDISKIPYIPLGKGSDKYRKAKVYSPKIKSWDRTIEDKVNRPFKEARKKDFDKPRMHLLPTSALIGIAKVMTYGAAKYNSYNYKEGKGLDWDRIYSACMRHLVAWNAGEDLDKESRQKHLYHAGCCIMMLIDLVDSKKGKDTRFRG